jgi:hypothetical protein
MHERRIRFALLAGWLLLGSAAGARAQLPPAVSVSVDPCVPVDHGKLHELLAIELGTSTAHGSAPAAATRVNVGCSPVGIELRVEDGVTRKSMARVLPASSFADASSTRLLALAIAEFVVASWIELRVQPAPAVEPIGPPAGADARRVAESAVAERTPEAAAQRSSERALFASGGLQWWPAEELDLFGGGLRLQLPLWDTLIWTVSADFGAASTELRYGELNLFTASAGLAIALELRLDEHAVLQLGPGARLGLTRIDADADPSLAADDEFTAPYGGPLWLTRLVVRLSDTLRVAIDAELGLTTLPASAEIQGEGTALELAGVWFNAVIGAGLAL